MLGRKDYTQEEFAVAKSAIDDRQLAAYRKLVKSVEATSDPKAITALEAFEPLFFNNLLLTLDRFFVHRLRMVAGKDGNPLNELELLTESLLRDGVFRANNVIKLPPQESCVRNRGLCRLLVRPPVFVQLRAHRRIIANPRML